MWRFAEWLLAEERSLVDPSVLNSYEQAFQQRPEELIRRTQAPDLKAAFEDMRRCPIKGMAGKCSRFTDYIMAALVKQGLHRQYDPEGSLQRIVFKMIGKTGERGLPHKGVFDFDESRPYNLRLGNPVQVVFKKYLSNEIRAIGMGDDPIDSHDSATRAAVDWPRQNGCWDGLPGRHPRSAAKPGSRNDERPDRAAAKAIDAKPEPRRSISLHARKRIWRGSAKAIRCKPSGHRSAPDRADHRAIRTADTELAHASVAGSIQRAMAESICCAGKRQAEKSEVGAGGVRNDALANGRRESRFISQVDRFSF